MQLHVTSPIPKFCAERIMQNTVRGRKMITETQQIIACAQAKFGHQELIKTATGELYKTPAWIMNHPVTKWASQDQQHLFWCVRYLYWLHRLYQGDAFQNVSQNIDIVLSQIPKPKQSIKDIVFLNFAKSKQKNLDFTYIENVFEAYDNFLKAQNS